MLYISAFTPLIIILISVGLGFPARNWFLEFGLAVVVISSITTIALAIQSARAAAKAEKWTFDDFLPKVDDGRSYNFKFTAGIMGVDTRNPVDHLRRQIDELQRVAIQDEDNAIRRHQLTDRRIDICLAKIRHHETVTLPKVLGSSSGAVALSAMLTLLGSVYLAFPVPAYEIFSACAQRLSSLW
ncbi:hypothetical protein PS664_02064 [Pseudomonas fluorescens]|nr:hypothetical protein PS664_02064 [Pseudomonas fluorescens]